jgi:hypothetical protein
MTRPIVPDDGPPQTRPVVDVRTLWAGGVATAIVAALVALVGVVVCRWLFNIPLLSPQSQGTYGDAHTTDVVILAAAAALLATGLIQLLIITTPRPMRFFGWVVGLATLAAMLMPFVTDESRGSRWYTAGLNLVLGVAIGTLVAGVAKSSLRPAVPGPLPYGPPPIPPQYR